MEEILIRKMTRDDFPFADSVRKLSGWNQTLPDWDRLLTFCPDGCFVACFQGTPTATLTTSCYQDKLAWIGMVLTHPDFRRRGIAGELMKHALQYLQGRGISCIKLDATPQGKPLYEQLGFQEEYHLHRWTSPAWLMPAGEKSCGRVRLLTPNDWEEVTRLDHEAYGISRGDYLAMLSMQSESSMVILDRTEKIAGFGMRRRGMIADYLGPLCARSFSLLPPLVSALTAGGEGRPLFWDIPDFQTEAISLAKRLGLQPLRELHRMYYQTNVLPGNPGLLFGISDPATG